MDTILVLETIVGSLVEATLITIKAGHHHLCLLIFLHVLLHLWDSMITIVTVTVTVTAPLQLPALLAAQTETAATPTRRRRWIAYLGGILAHRGERLVRQARRSRATLAAA